VLLPNNKLFEYQNNPKLFIQEALDDNPRWFKQTEIIESVRDNRNTYVKSCHGVGKTYTAKDVALWFLYCHVPSKVITTAPSWPQVEKLLWSEINNAHKTAKAKLGGSPLKTALNIDDEWFALGISPKIESDDDGSRMTGFHSPNMLIIFDEAPAVNAKLWEIKETLMTSEHVRFLAIGNPVVDSGHFFEGFRGGKVNAINMLIFDSPNFQTNKVTSKEDLLEISKLPFLQKEEVLNKMINPFKTLTNVRWAVDRLEKWGIDSPIFQARVLGEFPEKTEDTIISYSALERCKLTSPKVNQGKILGIDVARFGNDNTVFVGYNNGYQSVKKKWNGQNLVKTANEAKHLMKYDKYQRIVIDDTGLGGGVTDMLQEFKEQEGLRTEIIPVNFAESSNDEDYDGIVTEMWWNAKDLIESQSINVTDEGELFQELSNRKYKYTNKGKFKVESKDDYKKRTNKESPDEADAFILCQWGNKSYISDIESYGDRETVEQW
jgi:phage terminase large subunit